MIVLQKLSPRRHLAAAVGWTVFALVTTAAVIAASVAASQAERGALDSAQALLSASAVQARSSIIEQLRTHRAIVQSVAIQLAAVGNRGHSALRLHLETLQEQFPEFVWLGVADARGQITEATSGQLEGGDASELPWFKPALIAPVFNVMQRNAIRHTAPKQPALRVTAQAMGLLSVAAPLRGADGQSIGVLGGYLPLVWMDAFRQSIEHGFGPMRKLQVFIVAADNTVVLGPSGWSIGAPIDTHILGEHGAYLVGEAAPIGATAGNLMWHVVLRQPSGDVMASALHAGHTVFFIVLVAGLLAAAASIASTRILMRRLTQLSGDAGAVRRGERSALIIPSGTDEIHHIGHALADLVAHLQHEKGALTKLNSELDLRVAERTERIERLAHEARHAAVTRERLRIARELHDTLSHSLMALLTQIRLVRKLYNRMSTAEINEELGRAESVVIQGLAQARTAITQIRDGGVCDIGLGAALQDLLVRFRERSGIEATLHVDPSFEEMADERAQTVFRIVEEALYNVQAHARATRVDVTLQRSSTDNHAHAARQMELTIVDNGIGFDVNVPHQGHYGLLGMREQAALIDAALRIESTHHIGTRIVLTLTI